MLGVKKIFVINQPKQKAERRLMPQQTDISIENYPSTVNINVLILCDLICHQSFVKTREKFVPVTEDCMLLGVGVIAVAAFILRKWEQVK